LRPENVQSETPQNSLRSLPTFGECTDFDAAFFCSTGRAAPAWLRPALTAALGSPQNGTAPAKGERWQAMGGPGGALCPIPLQTRVAIT